MSLLHFCVVRLSACMSFLYLCIGSGFAASRAESLRLSVKLTTLWRLRRPRRSLHFSNCLPESRRLSARKAAKPQTNYREGAAAKQLLGDAKTFCETEKR